MPHSVLLLVLDLRIVYAYVQYQYHHRHDLDAMKGGSKCTCIQVRVSSPR